MGSKCRRNSDKTVINVDARNPSDCTSSHVAKDLVEGNQIWRAVETDKEREAEIVYISSKNRGKSCVVNGSYYVSMDMIDGCDAADKIVCLDSLADEPNKNFISFDQPDPAEVDGTLFNVPVVGRDKNLEMESRNDVSSIFLDASECEGCSVQLAHGPTDGQQLELNELNSCLPFPDLEMKSTVPETAEQSADNSLVCSDAQIKDKALCVNGARVNPDSLEPLKGLKVQTDFSPSDKNNCHSVDENFEHTSINVNRNNNILIFSEDAMTENNECFRYDPIGLSMASYRSSGVVCHCLRSCRKSSLISIENVAAIPSEPSTSPCKESLAVTTSPSSPIHILSPSSSKSSVSSFFSLVPDGEQFWDDILLCDNCASYDSEQDICANVPDQCFEKNIVGSSTTDSGWSDGECMLSQSSGMESEASFSKAADSCLCQVCGCAEKAYQKINSGPFSPMWDWTFPTVEDVNLASDPSIIRDPGDYSLGAPVTDSPCLNKTFSSTADNSNRYVMCGEQSDSPGSIVTASQSPAIKTGESSSGDQAKSKLGSRSSSPSRPSSSSQPSLTLSNSASTQQNTQPVVTLFNHSLNFWKMEID